MKKSTLAISIILVVVVLGYFIYSNSNKNKVVPTDTTPTVTVSDPKNTTYTIEGQQVTLVNGVSEVEAAPGSASKVTTTYFGNDVTHDFDGDGRDDVAFVLTQNSGGSGTFYYVVAALNKVSGYVGSQALLLGDRIKPQSTEMGKGNIIVVNYFDRKSSESFATEPTVAKSIWLLLDPASMQFGEVAQNFEGEADPNVMKLDMQPWKWINTTYSDGKVITPKSDKFVLTFNDAKRFSATTDCNGVGGEYTVKDKKITFDKMMSTLMYCEGSQEADFSKSISEASSYHFTSKGELIFDLKFDSGTVTFR